MGENRAAEILQRLKSALSMPQWPELSDPYETLVRTIISQNTSEQNTTRAFENLSKHFKIDPKVLSNAKISQIERCLHAGGLYRNKAKVIKQVSKVLMEKYHGSLKPILILPFAEARKTLLELPGIGPKTADVVLLFSAKKPTIPVDTHVDLVSKRLGFAPANGKYEDVRASLQGLYQAEDYFPVHVLLIEHGRKYCKARHPLCEKCPINMYCPTRGQWK